MKFPKDEEIEEIMRLLGRSHDNKSDAGREEHMSICLYAFKYWKNIEYMTAISRLTIILKMTDRHIRENYVYGLISWDILAVSHAGSTGKLITWQGLEGLNPNIAFLDMTRESPKEVKPNIIPKEPKKVVPKGSKRKDMSQVEQEIKDLEIKEGSPENKTFQSHSIKYDTGEIIDRTFDEKGITISESHSHLVKDDKEVNQNE